MINNKASCIDLKAISKIQRRMLHTPLPTDHIYHDIASRILERLDYIRISPSVILIIGIHTETLYESLKNRYPTAKIIIAPTLEKVASITQESVDFVISNFTVLQEREPLYFLQECNRVLRNEGLLLFTTLGPDTFFELRQAFSAADKYPHVHDFIDMHYVGDWLRDLKFADPVVDREEMCLLYDDLDLLFLDLKTIGASNAHHLRRRGLMTQNQLKKMRLLYEQIKDENHFPVTLELIYGHGWKVKQVEEKNTEFYISVDAIKRK